MEDVRKWVEKEGENPTYISGMVARGVSRLKLDGSILEGFAIYNFTPKIEGRTL